MAWRFTTNVLLGPRSDKVGRIFIEVKNALVATGRWRVRGTGDGKAAFQLMGQTAGVAGSFDVFTASPPWMIDGAAWGGANTLSNGNAWILLEEIASGRVFLIKRHPSGSNYTEAPDISAAKGCASSGASATVPPALTGGVLLLNGSGSQSFANPYTDYTITTATETWLQIAADDSVKGGNASPWWLATWSRTSNIKYSGVVWGALVDTDPSVVNAVVVAAGPWGNVFGNVGDGNSGALITGSFWRGGDTWDRCTFSYLANQGIGSSPPTYQQLGTDNKYRTQRPWILQPALGSRHIGRLEDFYMNKVAREYPTTYDVAGATPRVTLGHLIAPWTSVVPEASP